MDFIGTQTGVDFPLQNLRIHYLYTIALNATDFIRLG